MPSLVRIDDASERVERYPLNRPLISIGSGAGDDIRLDDPEVVEQQAVVRFDGASFQLQATQRRHPVRVDGKKRKKHTLADGEELEFGSTRLRVDLLETGVARAEEARVEKLHDRIEEYRTLHEFARRLLGEDYELPSLLETMMDAVIELSSADKGFLILAEQGGFHIKVARNVSRETISDGLEKISDSIVGKVIATREPLIVSDALRHEEFKSAQSVVNLKLSSVMCVPLIHKGGLLGVIYVGNENVAHLFTERHLETLTIFASQASLILANAILVNELKLDNRQLSQKLEDRRFGSIIGACDAMRDVFRTIEKVAPTNVNVLVGGETGTGKELIAHELHSRSPRADHPLVTINCGAIPESLLESELFGHVKGAFTGATQTREGKFQAAEGGTIFLDEIGEMPLNLQVKLLRVLQERTITKVGATRSEKVDIRVIAATNRNLEEAVERNEFREDLYYRLNVVMIGLPPLRRRGDDVVLIARYLIERIGEEFDISNRELGADAIAAMKRYAWPGNIRQLENRLKKALVLADRSVLTPLDLDLPPEVLEPVLPLAEAKERYAFRYVMEALERNDHNRTQTARELEVDPRTIFRYLEKKDEFGWQ